MTPRNTAQQTKGRVAFVFGTLLSFAAGAAHAQVGQQRSPSAPPSRPAASQTPFVPPPSARPGAIPMPGVGAIQMAGIGNLTGSATTPYAGAFAPRSAVIIGPLTTTAQGLPSVPLSPGYYRAPNGAWYYYPGSVVYGGGSTVVVTGPAYPTSSAYPPYGYYGYVGNAPTGFYPLGRNVTDPGTIEVQSNAYQSTVTLNGATQITVFNGYAPVYVPGQTVLSPFGAFYGVPTYIQSSYVLNTPYTYRNGLESGSVQVWSDSNDRYVSENAHRTASLRTALNDLTRFWENNDSAALARHVALGLSVAVFRGERFNYSLDRTPLLSLFNDARARVATSAFRFTEVRRRDDGLVNAYARHLFRRPGDTASTLHSAVVRCTLVYINGDWQLSAVAFTPEGQEVGSER